jgi:hypothetical protein
MENFLFQHDDELDTFLANTFPAVPAEWTAYPELNDITSSQVGVTSDILIDGQDL